MREIKCRGKRVDNGEWVYGELITLYNNKTWIAVNTELYDNNANGSWILSVTAFEIIPETVGQYTGLKDKNGKEIYEGNIFKRYFEMGHEVFNTVTMGVEDYVVDASGYYVGVVCYRATEGFILNKCNQFNDNGELVRKLSGKKIYAKRGEVIGNIHDNKDLLKGANQ